jgi:hypothetical protein
MEITQGSSDKKEVATKKRRFDLISGIELGFVELPKDIIVLIARYCDIRTRFKLCCTHSKLKMIILNNPSLWTNLQFTNKCTRWMSNRALISILKQVGMHLECLNLNFLQTVLFNTPLQEIGEYCPLLKSFILSSKFIVSIWAVYLVI